MAKKFDTRRVKIHRNYNIGECASLVGGHKNTVLAWVKNGLPCINDRRPWLILGRDLIAFLKNRHASAKRPCAPNQLFCLRCKTPRLPAGLMLDYFPTTLITGDLKGLCDVCGCWLNRKVSLTKISLVAPDCSVAFPLGQERIADMTRPCSNSDKTKEDAQ